jgi:hypothetical protein
MTWLPFLASALAVAVILWLTRNDHRDGYREGYFDATHGIPNAYPPDDPRDDLAARRVPPSGP